MTYYVAVVGSRNYPNLAQVDITLDNYIEGIEELSKAGTTNLLFISGGAKGVDSVVKLWCDNRLYDFDVILPINKEDKMSYLFRNVEIVTLADEIIAFWDGKSRGTKFVIDYAKARSKKVTIITPKNLFGD